MYDGRDSTAKRTNTYCDNHNQINILSTGPYLYILFKSDRHKEKQGFAAEFQFIDDNFQPPGGLRGMLCYFFSFSLLLRIYGYICSSKNGEIDIKITLLDNCNQYFFLIFLEIYQSYLHDIFIILKKRFSL